MTNEEIQSENADCEVKCPHCQESWQDVWEYFKDTNALEIKTDCPFCDKPIIIRKEYEVTYFTRKDNL